MRTNDSELVELSVAGLVTSAVWSSTRPYRIGADGKLRALPGTGGICYSHCIGDSAIAIKGDHVEPGVTIRANSEEDNSALNNLACIGNIATVVSGAAKGLNGVVTGKHGGVEHVMVDFPHRGLAKLKIGDMVQIKAVGQGLELLENNKVTVMNCAPNLLKALRLSIKQGKINIAVSHFVPAAIMGSGLGAVSSYSGDCDIQMFDSKIVAKFGLDSLRFGDIVAITDADSTYGRRYYGGAVSIGVIVHSRSDVSGHGPGVTTILTSKDGMISPTLSKQANIGYLLKIGRWRKK